MQNSQIRKLRLKLSPRGGTIKPRATFVSDFIIFLLPSSSEKIANHVSFFPTISSPWPQLLPDCWITSPELTSSQFMKLLPALISTTVDLRRKCPDAKLVWFSESHHRHQPTESERSTEDSCWSIILTVVDRHWLRVKSMKLRIFWSKIDPECSLIEKLWLKLINNDWN